jgi:hypothetical protein
MADPFLEFDLARELDELHCEPEPASGQNAKTLVKYDDFRIVLTALRAHTRIPGHWTRGRVSLQTVQGHIRERRLEPPRPMSRSRPIELVGPSVDRCSRMANEEAVQYER